MSIKGLGAPVGSLLIVSKSFVKQSRRIRKVFGGGMRQAGIIAAGGLYALKNNIDRLKTDHLHAKVLECILIECSWVKEVIPVQTNIVVAVLADISKRDSMIEAMAERGIRTVAFGPGMIRFVTHLDISSESIDKTSEILKVL